MTGRLGPSSSVCAVIPHFECEAWLPQAIESVLDQTRPPDAVVVVDDASPVAPFELVARYPEVTLLTAADNGGPYRLLQAVIDGSDHDAYLMQDADDWSAPDRLEVLLGAAEATGAELVGSHETRVLVDAGDIVAVRYPADVNAALRTNPTGFALLHPTSLVGRSLARRLGGFATGMRFGGDAEFLRRAVHAATVVNANHFGYFRRKRAGSLTTDPATAHHSPERIAVQAEVAAVAAANARAVARGQPPQLGPWRRAPAPALSHLAGPPLRGDAMAAPARSRRAPGRSGALGPTGRAAPRQRDGHAGAGPLAPVFLVGAPRSGGAFLLWALDHHPRLAAVPDARWVAGLLADVAARCADDSAPVPAGLSAAVAGTVAASAAGASGRRWVAGGSAVTAAIDVLARSFPDARFLHAVRDVDEVVADLMARPTDGGAYYTPDRAWRGWLAGARAGLAAERRLGPGRVRRVGHAELLRGPAATVESCLSFLDEDPHPACRRALDALAPSPLPEAAPGPPEVVLAARRLSADLVAGRPVDDGAIEDDDALVATGGRPGEPEPLADQVRRFIAEVVPAGAGVAVASKGDPRLVQLGDRTGLHFPQVPDGTYAGHHPGDSDEAVALLEQVRAAGAAYLVLPSAAFWWLAHYPGLRRHLAEQYQLVAFHEESGVAYRLTRHPGGGHLGGSPPPRVVVLGDPDGGPRPRGRGIAGGIDGGMATR